MTSTATDHDGNDLYLRFGDVPEGERSTDTRNDRTEDGVSVFPVTTDDVEAGTDTSGFVEEPTHSYHPYGPMVQTAILLMARDTYLVRGERAGTGADGEPVIRDVEIVTQVTSPSGCGGWVPGKYEEIPEEIR